MRLSNWYDNSCCKGCEYGERITGGVFCNEIQGLVPVGYQGCKAQNDYYDGMYKEENGMTLTELAKRLRKIFRFKYLTVSPDFCGCPAEIYCWTSIRPAYNAKGSMWIISQEGSQTIACSFEGWHLETSLDLSEYADEHGEVDYSRCIVEVE